MSQGTTTNYCLSYLVHGSFLFHRGEYDHSKQPISIKTLNCTISRSPQKDYREYSESTLYRLLCQRCNKHSKVAFEADFLVTLSP